MASEAPQLRGLLLDGLAVTGLAGILVAIHVLLPPGVRDALALRYAEPDPLHAWTAAFVHLTDGHLIRNVTALLAGGWWAIAVSAVAGERRWFRLTFLSYLTVLPITVGLAGAVVIGEQLTARGFSGVVAGFAGFGLVAIAVVLSRVFGVNWWLARVVTAGVSFVLAAEILWLVGPPTPLLAGGVFMLGVACMVFPVVWVARPSESPTDRLRGRWVATIVGVTGLLSIMPLVFVIGLFPTDFAAGESITNILAHYLGLVSGAVIAGWGYRYWSVEPPDVPGNRRS